MQPKKAFKFCPKCAGQLIPQKENSLECIHCHFHLYINPFPTNGAIVENHTAEILLIKRKFPPKKGWWDVPGGFIQPQESVETSVKRELMEELYVDVVIKRLIGIYTDTYLFDGVINYIMCIMVSADIKSGAITPGDDAETYEFFSKKEVLNQKIAFEGVRKGITDYLLGISFPNLTQQKSI